MVDELERDGGLSAPEVRTSRLRNTKQAMAGQSDVGMNSKLSLHGTRGPRSSRRGYLFLPLWAFVSLSFSCADVFSAQAAVAASERQERSLSYRRDVVSDVPWSIHILQVDRSNSDLEFHTVLAKGATIGLTELDEQIRYLPPELGKPVAAINGDFYRNDNTAYKGDPKGLQIMQGELVSAPCDWSCFWIDAEGKPQMTNITTRFEVIWPNGAATPIGLNEERKSSLAVLYTARLGKATGTTGGRELVLEPGGSSAGLPLRAGETYFARVREVRENGNMLLSADRLVLSLPKEMLNKVPQVQPGAVLKISLATSPSLKGVKTAIGGGPALIHGGKAKEWGLLQLRANIRHPRTAIGWNDKYFYLVEVDGRQPGLSVGMTLSELAEYMLKKLGCTEALNLDGGRSAAMWVYGQIANSPAPGFERGMANALVIVQKPENGK